MLSFFISINEMINADSVSKKLIYGTCNTIFIMGIILTYSKLTYLVFPFMLLVYLLQEKDKSKRIYIQFG